MSKYSFFPFLIEFVLFFFFNRNAGERLALIIYKKLTGYWSWRTLRFCIRLEASTAGRVQKGPINAECRLERGEHIGTECGKMLRIVRSRGRSWG